MLTGALTEIKAGRQVIGLVRTRKYKNQITNRWIEMPHYHKKTKNYIIF